MKIPPLHIIRLLGIVLGFTLLAGCVSNSSLVSSFSQRKYTKGCFDNSAGEKPLVISKPTRLEDKRTGVSGTQNNTVAKVATDRDNPKAIQRNLKQIPSPEGQRVGLRISSREVNKALSVTEQTKATHSETSATDDSGSDPQLRKRMGIFFLFLGAIFLGLGLFNFAGISALFILAGIVLVIIGLVKLFTYTPQFASAKPVEPTSGPSRNDPIQGYTNSKGTDSSVGLAGLLMVIGGVLLSTLALFLLLAAALGGGSSLALVALFAGLVGLALLIIGTVLCIQAVKGNDRYRSCAVAGLVIVGIIVASYLLTILISIFRFI